MVSLLGINIYVLKAKDDVLLASGHLTAIDGGVLYLEFRSVPGTLAGLSRTFTTSPLLTYLTSSSLHLFQRIPVYNSDSHPPTVP